MSRFVSNNRKNAITKMVGSSPIAHFLLALLLLTIWPGGAYSMQSCAGNPDDSEHKFSRPAFWSACLVNLPTTHILARGELLFRISHRYNQSVQKGHEYLYGLDGPARILLSLGYGIRHNLSATLGRTNLNDVVELSLKWLMVQQDDSFNLPFAATVDIGGSIVTELKPCHDLFESQNMKFNAQLCLSHQRSESVSFLLAPAYSSNTNHWESNPKGTFTMGVGGRFMLVDNLSLVGEWLPVLSGYEAKSTGWGAGLEYKTGGHVFQLFVTNSIGLTRDQFLPGGDLKLSDGDCHLGFNIFRSVWF